MTHSLSTRLVGTQEDPKDRAACGGVLDQEATAVGLDDRAADRQPQAQPIRLGREERLEDSERALMLVERATGATSRAKAVKFLEAWKANGRARTA